MFMPNSCSGDFKLGYGNDINDTTNELYFDIIQHERNILAERGFDPRTSGLWAQHASTAPLCFDTHEYQTLHVCDSYCDAAPCNIYVF